MTRLLKWSATQNEESSADVLRPLRPLYYTAKVTADRIDAAVIHVKETAATLVGLSTQSEATEIQLRDDAVVAMREMEGAVSRMKKATEMSQAVDHSMQRVQEEIQTITALFTAVEELLQKSSNTIHRLHDIVHDTSRRVDEFVMRVESVQSVLDAIENIARETMLLALNAAIEAAHAGQSGAGFSILAEEIRQLADRSRQTLKTSVETLDRIRADMSSLKTTTANSHAFVEAGTAGIQDVTARVHEAARHIEEVARLAQITAAAASKQRETFEDTQRQMGHASRTLEKMVHELDEMLQLASEQRIQVEKLDYLANHLADTSARMGEALRKLDDTFAMETPGVSVDTRQLTQMQQQLENLAKHPRILSMDPEAHASLLYEWLQTEHAIEAVWSNRSDGSFIYSEPPAGLVNASHRPWFQGAMSGAPFISRPYISAITQQPCLTIAVPVFGDDGSVIGCIGADVRIQL
ncbi:methyl-accepting chemotaxis sensory transducer [Alicyclobacillus cellulosilyticus]|uniref:Methyl-accepting chemotaxis sensory transducer n=1 Tax=Alicyclobacillus cellulosilyticus TaxID=1003997 RepID=A0A917KFU7_9BACL|nr:methyl-accepting chemotaxis protein [Alicyclobacillus cellulosilyticus]GGJ12667.1 methyl-accepting chemotaxis sensory transducer [Alicyclobacillus cellulosilyticus]